MPVTDTLLFPTSPKIANIVERSHQLLYEVEEVLPCQYGSSWLSADNSEYTNTQYVTVSFESSVRPQHQPFAVMATLKALVYTLIAITISAGLYLYKKRQQHLFPAINDYADDHSRKKAYARYEAEAKELIATGLAEHQGPVTILTPGGPKLILPASLSDWVKANKTLITRHSSRTTFSPTILDSKP